MSRAACSLVTFATSHRPDQPFVLTRRLPSPAAGGGPVLRARTHSLKRGQRDRHVTWHARHSLVPLQ
jgi:hypothetical protein